MASQLITLSADCKRFLAFSATYLTWIEGPKSGERIEWEPWQIAVFNAILSRDESGKRKYTTALCQIAKGNGKSTMAAALALFFLIVESARIGDKGMQIYAIAASRDQARIVFGNAKRMVEASPLLLDWVTITQQSLHVPSTGAIFQALSSDAPKTHGKRPSIVMCDELHAHENGELFESMETGMVTAAEPLMVVWTNAGANEQGDSKWAEVFRRGRDGHDPKMFFYCPTVPDDRVDDPEAWKLANPASWVTAERLYDLSRKMPTFVFRRFHLNKPTRAEKEWLPKGSWDSCESSDRLEPGETVTIGLDLSRRHDSTAVVVIAPRSDTEFVAMCETWATWGDPSKPEPNVHHVVEDETIPMNLVFDRVRELCRTYDVREIAYDPYRLPDLVAEQLEAEGLPMVRYDQNVSRMAPACAGLFDAIASQKLKHAGDPIFSAQVAAATVKSYGHRGWTLDKTKARDFMDAAIALAIGLDRAKEYVGSAADFAVRWF